MSDQNTTEKPTSAKAALGWWGGLQRLDQDGAPNGRADPGALAALRRASRLVEAASEPACLSLHRALALPGKVERTLEKAAALAMILAHIRDHAKTPSVARLLGPQSIEQAETAVLSPLRMKRFVGARDAEETIRGFREAIALLKGVAPVADVARLVLGWLDEAEHGERIRTRFVFDYYNAGSAAPADDEPAPNA
jgi:CRISPR type I-E-associated protein CasB/Cse2